MPAAVRLPRTAMARRALLVVLFLGGLMGLAILFGGSAHAAESESDGSSSAGQLLEPAAEMRQQAREHFSASEARADERRHADDANTDANTDADADKDEDPSAEQRQAMKDAVAETVRPITDRTEQLAHPVRDLVEDTTDAAGLPVELPEGLQGGDQQLPGTGRPSLPGGLASGSDGVAGAVTAGSRTDLGDASAASSHDCAGSAEQEQPGGADEHRKQLPAQLPTPPAPSGSAYQHAGDGSGPRGGDAHAASPSGAPRFGLAAGAIRAASTTPTRDRSSEILEFPG
ncbi:hypothetical protein [Streptomyces sp. 7N604]|uniref:hypothetical protein n=1 Tax=Streptomyces sp. 7N604 TaxID=3457415 RepID=UPI003FD1BA03